MPNDAVILIFLIAPFLLGFFFIYGIIKIKTDAGKTSLLFSILFFCFYMLIIHMP